MRHLPNVLLVFALPAGAVGYAVGARVLDAVAPSLSTTIVALFVPLFVAGLCMVPFFLPYLDRRAKADLAAIQARRAAEEATTAEGAKPAEGATTGTRPAGRAKRGR